MTRSTASVRGRGGWGVPSLCGLVKEVGLSQACMGGGGPLCLQHPSWSAGPGASIGRGCTT